MVVIFMKSEVIFLVIRMVASISNLQFILVHCFVFFVEVSKVTGQRKSFL